MSIYRQGIVFELVECCKCSVPMMMPNHMMKRLKQTKGDFYCVACGQVQGWYGKTAEEKRIEQLERVTEYQRRRAEAAEQKEQHALHQVRAQKAAKTRLKKRIQNGVCPCCNRHFVNLHRHMQSKHPGYAGEVHLVGGSVLKQLRGSITQAAIADEVGTKPQYVSMYENDRPLPIDARERIENWIEQKKAK